MKKQHLRALMLLSLVALLLILGACGNQPESEQPGQTPAEQTPGEQTPPAGEAVHAEAEELFMKTCVSCHGNDLAGRMGESSNLQTVGARLSEAEIYEVIKNGRNLMPSFDKQLSEDQLQGLSAWLSTQK